MYGKIVEKKQNEKTPLNPQSPYAISKVFGHYITDNYRKSYGMFAVSGILFNHESPLRGEEFVTRKITLGLVKILNNDLKCLELGNIYANRDWGFKRICKSDVENATTKKAKRLCNCYRQNL